ncbi:fructosamine-3-kinase-like [Ylistrum balloti]|uniref:fructosamine-3-kinase-like n=1 Tax=Ylistrum balloti TaxID=509963 RepID=UPI0029059B5A|nr:fructosamine-3-kinase-like [Ylistrum balloti]
MKVQLDIKMEDNELEDLLKERLNLNNIAFVENRNGYISEGKVFQTEDGSRIFVKVNRKQGARLMFEGEVASLEALKNTNEIRVPNPIKIMNIPTGGSALVMEFLDITELSNQQAALGEKLARLHLHNDRLRRRAKATECTVGEYERSPIAVEKFGFDMATCVGFLPQPVSWSENWTTYFSNLLDYRIGLIEKQASSPVDTVNAHKMRELWTEILLLLPGHFRNIDIKPSLLHGDLHVFNSGETKHDGPVIFDPASFYGHSEIDLSVGFVYPGFNQQFYDAYFKLIPKAPGFEGRLDLYMLNQILNYWNHFGPKQCRQRTIDLMKKITDTKPQ